MHSPAIPPVVVNTSGVKDPCSTSSTLLAYILFIISSAITETTLQVVSSRFRQVQFLTCFTKIKGQSSRSKHVTKIIWGELINTFILVIELSGVQFGLKWYAWFQNRRSAQRESDLKSQVWFQTKNCTTQSSITTLLHLFGNHRVLLSILIFYFCYFISILMG